MKTVYVSMCVIEQSFTVLSEEITIAITAMIQRATFSS